MPCVCVKKLLVEAERQLAFGNGVIAQREVEIGRLRGRTA